MNAYVKPDYGEFLDSNTNSYKTGPFTLKDTAQTLNTPYGTCDITAAAGGIIQHSGKYFNRVAAHASNCEAVYTPRSGWLDGVKTRLTAFNIDGDNYYAPFIYAVIEYNSTSKTVDMPKVYGFVELGEFDSVEKVTIKSKTPSTYYIPPVSFEVIDDYNGVSNHPYIPVRKYENPQIGTVSPKNNPNPAPNPGIPVRINEVLSQSDSGDDWIELYNGGSGTVDISGWAISDSKSNPMKCPFPGGTAIEPGSFLMVRAGSYDVQTATLNNDAYLANFAISKGGENILLSDSNRNIVDFIDVPALETDKTFARYPDGTNNFRLNAAPTFHIANTNTGEVYYPKPEFSHTSGFYNESFELTISGAGGTIHYTTDGSEPTADSPAAQASIMVRDRRNDANVLCAAPYTPYWSHPAGVNSSGLMKTVAARYPVDKSTIVRAAIFDGETRLSNIATMTYFVDHNMKDDFNNMPVLSVVTDPKNLFDMGNGKTTILKGTPPPGENPGNYYLYRNNGYGIFTHASSSFYNGGRYIPDPLEEGWERPAHYTLFDRNGSVMFHQNGGMRVRGLGSSNESQVGFNLFARARYSANNRIDYPIFENNPMMPSADNKGGTEVESFKSIAVKQGGRNYKTPHYIDPVVLELTKELKVVPTQSARPCVVFIDGEFWGTYFLEERVSVDFLQDHYGINSDDVLLSKGSGPASEVAKGTTTESELNEMKSVLTTLNSLNLNNDADYKKMDALIDVEEFMLYYGMNFATGNIDWEPSGYNFAFWRSRNISDSPYEDGRIRLIMNDLDCAYYDGPNSRYMWDKS